MIGLIVNEVSVWTAARRIRVGLATGENSAMQGLWDDYQGLAHRSLLGIGLVGVKAPLKERLRAQADRVIADYRQDEPTVREAQWRDAATWLTDVLHLDPGDRAAAARLRYCEGQLQRIDGEARKRKKQPATEAFRDAVAKFEEAGRVDSRWPDPYLGLARTYIYGLDDLDKAIAAMKEAEQRGYRPGNRELVQLADGYRNRADRWRREAAAVRGLDQERDVPPEGGRRLPPGARPLSEGDRLRRGERERAGDPVAPRRGAEATGAGSGAGGSVVGSRQ